MANVPLPQEGMTQWGDDLNAYLADMDSRVQFLEAGGGTIEIHPTYTGLTLYFGPLPLPPASTMPNTVYVALPAPPV